MTVQEQKWLLFSVVTYDNSTNAFSYTVEDINQGTQFSAVDSQVYARQMDAMALIYEEYTVKSVTLYAQLAVGYTVDDKIKTAIYCRVDCNSQPAVSTLDTLETVISAQNTVSRTFTERSNIKLVTYRPICYSTGGVGASSRPLLPNNLQWYNIDERSSHLWRGATICPVIFEPSLQPNAKGVVIMASVSLGFRGRRISAGVLTQIGPAGAADAEEPEETDGVQCRIHSG